ncbi:MAG: efflux RND transporter permease subunit, partial [Bacteroidales bacterium]
MGIAVVPLLTIRLYPSESGKQIYISYQYYDATAEAVEMEATAPLEGVLTTVDGVQNVSSVSGDGWGQITLTIERDVDIQKVRFKILASIREVFPRLPQGVSYPTLSAYSANQEKMVQLLVYTVSANMDPPSIKSIASETLLPKLSMIDGVSKVDIYGANTNDWYIEYNSSLLEQLGLSPNN